MSEYRSNSGWSDQDAERFLNYDLNRDGLISAKEWLEADGGGGSERSRSRGRD